MIFFGFYLLIFNALTLSLPNLAKSKFRPNFQISFCEILKNKWHHLQVQAESFHLNGRIIRFRPQTQKLESPYKTPSSTPAVKGLRKSILILLCFPVYSSNKQEVLTFRLPQHVSNCIATAIFSYFLVHWKFMRHCSCALFCPSLSYFV